LIFNFRCFIIAQYRQKCISKNDKLTTFHYIFMLSNIKTFLIIFLTHSYFFKFIIKNFNSYHNIYFSFQLIKSAHKKDFETLVYLLNEAHCKKCFFVFCFLFWSKHPESILSYHLEWHLSNFWSKLIVEIRHV